MNTQELLKNIYESQYSHRAKAKGPFGERAITYADYIASGQPLSIIESFIQEKVFPFFANTHTEASYTGSYTSHLREEARKIIKQSVNANEHDALIFCGSGSTSAIDRMNRLLHQRMQKHNEKIILFHGPLEHHSNLLPWREGKYTVVSIAITKQGLIDLDDLKLNLLKYQGQGTLIGSFSAASNVTGIISPVKEITALLHQFGAYSFWDYAAGAPYLQIDMNAPDNQHLDAIFISTHKFIGGPGTPGLLIAKKHLFDNEIPIIPSGGTVQFVTRKKQNYYEDIETREEGGTPAIIESIRAGLCFKLKNDIGVAEIEKREAHAIAYAFQELLHHPQVFILGNTECKRLAFIAFHIRKGDKFLHYNFVVALLNDLFGIQSRGGCSCAGPYGHELLEMSNEKSDEYLAELNTGNQGIKPGWSRLNLNYFIPEFEIRFIVNAIKWIAENGYLLLKQYHFDDNTSIWTHVDYEQHHHTSLYDFNVSETAASQVQKIDREAIQKSYFDLADAIAAKAKQQWKETPCQEYHHRQIDNPLRWYTLAQDIEINE